MTTVIFTLAADDRGASALEQGLVLAIVGMLVVFVALTLIAAAIILLNRCLGSESTASAAAVDSTDPRLLAVLWAAAAVVAKRPVRLRRVIPASDGRKPS